MAENTSKSDTELPSSPPQQDESSEENIEANLAEESKVATANSDPEQDAAIAVSAEPEKPAESAKSGSNAAKSPAKEIDVAKELALIDADLKKISSKNTTRLVTLENNLNRYRKLIAEADTDLLNQANDMSEALKTKFTKNNAHQIFLKDATIQLAKELEAALTEGKSDSALPTWDKIQGNISNTNDEIKKELKELVASYKEKIDELREWKVFAATEKKKSVIEQMRHLAESRMQAGDRSKHISRLHKEWKALGRSNQNDELWAQFKELSDKAYEPCKEHFKQRKQKMAENLKKRRELCDALETQLKDDASKDYKLAELNALLKSAEEQWKQTAPVEQSKIKPLQKRYYATLNTLRKLRRGLVKDNLKAKAEIIEKASALTQLEDRKLAMTEAKALQQQWKTIGPSSYKDDKKQWEIFRGICDEVFARPKDEKSKDKPARSNKDSSSRQHLDAMFKKFDEILKLKDEELRNVRSQYQDLQQAFAEALDAIPGKLKTRYREQFNNFKRKLDTRFKSLPDKKSKALLELITRCLDYLRPFESKVLEDQASSLEEVKESFDEQHWQDLTKERDSEYVSLLQRRAEVLVKTNSLTEFENAAKMAKESFRELCIQAEIRAGTDTPEPDQPKRMEIQLKQLKDGFGRNQHDGSSNMHFMQESRIKSLCLGPIRESEQKEYRERLEKSLQRLL